MSFLRILSLLFVIFHHCNVVLAAPPLNHWQTVAIGNPHRVRGPAVVSVGLLAVGSNGEVFFSKTGEDWVTRSTGVTNDFWRAIEFRDRIVVVGDGGLILTSVDGVNWIRAFSGVTNSLFGLAKSTETLVAVGDGGIILTTTNAASWTIAPSGATSAFRDVEYGNGAFIAVGKSFVMRRSSDEGKSWQRLADSVGITVSAIEFGLNRWVAVTFFDDDTIGEADILTSADGLNWESKSSGTTEPLLDVTFGEGAFVISTGSSSPSPTVLTSTNGVDWAFQSIPNVGYYFFNMIFFNRRFVGVGDQGFVLLSDPFITVKPNRIPRDTLANLSIEAAVGQTYVVEKSRTLSNDWQPVAEILPTNSPQAVVVARTQEQPQFYRVRWH